MSDYNEMEDEEELLDFPEAVSETATEHLFVASPENKGARLDVFLAERIRHLSRSQIQRIVGVGGVQVNGVVAKPSYKVVGGDQVRLDIPPVQPTTTQPENIPLDIVYEDSDLIVLNKQKGLVVHPAPGAKTGTLVNALLYYCKDLSGIGGEERPGIVHRLDKDTSGLMMVAKNDITHNRLQAQIQQRVASRKYLALIWGRPPFNEAVIDAPIGRDMNDRKKMTVIQANSVIPGRSALTNVFVKETLGPITLVECVLQTGRTHQIRVHLSHFGYPVVADPIYGGIKHIRSGTLQSNLQPELNEKIIALHGQALHAYSLSFNHPRTEERMNFTAPLPSEMEEVIALLRNATTEAI